MPKAGMVQRFIRGIFCPEEMQRIAECGISHYDVLMRILVDVNHQQVSALNALAKRTGKARAEVIREALDKYVAAHRPSISAFYGLWAGDAETEDAQAYQDKLRSEWDREWDN